jgi:hypothetical protein
MVNVIMPIQQGLNLRRDGLGNVVRRGGASSSRSRRLDTLAGREEEVIGDGVGTFARQRRVVGPLPGYHRRMAGRPAGASMSDES